MAPYQHTYESAPANQRKKDRLSAFLANFGETERVLKALLALAKRQPDAASSPSPTRYSQPRFRTSRPYRSRRTHFHHLSVRYLNALQMRAACARRSNRTHRCRQHRSVSKFVSKAEGCHVVWRMRGTSETPHIPRQPTARSRRKEKRCRRGLSTLRCVT